MSLRHPAWMLREASDHLRLEGVSVSPRTVRNFWVKENLETKYKRLLRPEEEKVDQEVELTEE